MININDLNVNRVGPVDDVKESKIGNKFQSYSGVSFAELLRKSVNEKNKTEKSEGKPFEKSQIDQDQMRQSLAVSFAVMESLIKREERNVRSK